MKTIRLRAEDVPRQSFELDGLLGDLRAAAANATRSIGTRMPLFGASAGEAR
jgi:hypothetical protein